MAEPKEKTPAGNTVVYSYGGQYDPRTKTLSNLNMQPRETAGTEERVSRSGRPRGSTREKTESSMREKLLPAEVDVQRVPVLHVLAQPSKAKCRKDKGRRTMTSQNTVSTERPYDRQR